MPRARAVVIELTAAERRVLRRRDRGGKTPWRLKLRSASFSNMAVLPEVLPGHRVADLAPILGSLFFIVGDMDR